MEIKDSDNVFLNYLRNNNITDFDFYKLEDKLILSYTEDGEDKLVYYPSGTNCNKNIDDLTKLTINKVLVNKTDIKLNLPKFDIYFKDNDSIDIHVTMSR